MLVPFQQLKFTNNPDLTRLQQRVADSLRRVLGVAFLDGALISGISLSASAPTLVNHGLGRPISGWWVTDVTAPARIYRAAQGGMPDSILPLQADASTTVTVWVF